MKKVLQSILQEKIDLRIPLIGRWCVEPGRNRSLSDTKNTYRPHTIGCYSKRKKWVMEYKNVKKGQTVDCSITS